MIIYCGRKTVTVVGSPEQLCFPLPCSKVEVQAELDNTGVIAIGLRPNSQPPGWEHYPSPLINGPVAGTTSDSTTREGIVLQEGERYTAAVPNTDTIWLDAEVAGDGVTFLVYR